MATFRRQWQKDLAGGNDLRYREWSEASSATLLPTRTTESAEPTQGNIAELMSQSPTLESYYLPEDDRMDTESDNEKTSSDTGSDETLFIIATDFGTTFSSVSFSKVIQGRSEVPQTIKNYPDDPMTYTKQNLEVPTESWYPNGAATDNEIEKEVTTHDDGNVSEDSYEEDDDMEKLYEALYGEKGTHERHNNRDNENQDFLNNDQGAMELEEEIPNFPWGYQTQALMCSGNVEKSNFKCLKRFKLLLDESEKTSEVRDDLRPIIRQLKRRGIIKKDEDVIADYLTQLFLHTKKQLTLNHDFSELCAVKHVLCVPNVWTPKACRIMQQAMEIAIRRSDLGTLENLFIVSEPEAAATFVLHENSNIPINLDETFVILDAGGGTVDATTYTVNNTYPLRLKREAVEPTGDLCGSSYLNEEYRKGLLERIKEEHYLENTGQTLQNLVDEAVIDFENRLKRVAHYDDNKVKLKKKREIGGWAVKIPGLKASHRKRFKENKIFVEHVDIAKVFDPILDKISSLMIRQITEAIKAGFPKIQKVILIGGFAGSPLLQEHLRRKLSIISSKLDLQINLHIPKSSFETAVSLGAVLRTLEKGNGPERVSKSSYGFLRTEEHEPEAFQEHKEQRPTTDKLDGKQYVRNTIDWLVKVDVLPPRKRISIITIHTFPVSRKIFKCEELLYVSDTSTVSHYRATHPNNKGAEIAGRIIADMTFLRTAGIIQPIKPNTGVGGKPHYKVEFELVMIIDGRNLHYEARYPAGGQVQDRGQICIAAAFEPGTK